MQEANFKSQHFSLKSGNEMPAPRGNGVLQFASSYFKGPNKAMSILIRRT